MTISFDYDNTKYHVNFRHVLPDSQEMAERLAANPKIKYSRFTICYITRSGTKDIVATGIAYCSKKDVFDKGAGRKNSFTRAVQSLVADKATRKAIYTSYDQQTGREDFTNPLYASNRPKK